MNETVPLSTDMLRSLVHVALFVDDMPGHALPVIFMVIPVRGVQESARVPEQYAWTGRMPAGAMSRTPESVNRRWRFEFFSEVFPSRKLFGGVEIIKRFERNI